jgi:ethanolamine utilization protein EutA
MQRDMAAALGQLLSSQLPGKALIVLDGVGTEYGDYIDIGQPMSNGQFVPVVVKELVFAG